MRGDNNVPPAMVKWVKSRVDDVKKMPYMVAYTSSTAKRDELVKLCKKEFVMRRCWCSSWAAL